MKAIIIDAEKCIGCGKCVKDCVSEKLKIVDGKAKFMYERCIQCGHCYAICPTGAVTMSNYKGYEGEKPFDIAEFDSDKLLMAMKSRRTIRQFKDKNIPKEDIEKIIEAGRYCPTGTNAQDFHFTVIQKSIPEIEKECLKVFRFAQKTATPFSKFPNAGDVSDITKSKSETAGKIISAKA